MKFIILSLTILLSQNVFAGAPGSGGYFCESNSGRTKVTIIDRYSDGDVTIFFSIDDFSSLYEVNNSVTCEDDCMWIQKVYGDNNVTYAALNGDAKNWEINIAGDKAVITKGFLDPRDYSIFKSNINLKCKAVSEQI